MEFALDDPLDVIPIAIYEPFRIRIRQNMSIPLTHPFSIPIWVTYAPLNNVAFSKIEPCDICMHQIVPEFAGDNYRRCHSTYAKVAYACRDLFLEKS
jgi:hypothetical protein